MGVNTDWIRQCQQAIVGLDTAPLIYYIEEHPLAHTTKMI